MSSLMILYPEIAISPYGSMEAESRGVEGKPPPRQNSSAQTHNGGGLEEEA
jgi:hypothetical protein